MIKVVKTLRNLLYAGTTALAMSFLPGCDPEPDPEVKDTIPPEISMYSPSESEIYKTSNIPLRYEIDEKNFKNAWYSINNGAKISLPKSGTKTLNLAEGDYNLVMHAEDLAGNSDEEEANFSVDLPESDITPPKINITSPLEDIIYNSNDVSFSWNIEEANFKEAKYSVDNGTKTSLEGKSGTKTINLANGNHKIVVYAEDLYSNSSKDSVNFSTDKPSWTYECNPFESTNENGSAYDDLETRAQRDSMIQKKLEEDWTSEIAPSSNPLWDCTEYSKQLDINLHGFEGLEGYSGSNIDSIYANHETLKDNGKYGLPVYNAKIGLEHEMNAILTGDDATKFENWNFIEPQSDQMNVQPGQAYMPNNCEITLNYTYVKENDIEGKFLKNIPIFKFKIENGIPSFIWQSDDSNLNLITQREK